MTVILFNQKVICANCGTENRVDIVSSEYRSFGMSMPFLDLDGRVRHNKYDKMQATNIQECKYCGYASYDLSKELDFDANFLLSDAYEIENIHQKFSNSDSDEDVLRRYKKLALIDTKRRDYESAYLNYLYVSWCEDDIGKQHDIHFKSCRSILAILWHCLPQKIQNDKEWILRHLDVLRRAEMFGDFFCHPELKDAMSFLELVAIPKIKSEKEPSFIDKAFLAFEFNLIVKRDSERYYRDLLELLSNSSVSEWFNRYQK